MRNTPISPIGFMQFSAAAVLVLVSASPGFAQANATQPAATPAPVPVLPGVRPRPPALPRKTSVKAFGGQVQSLPAQPAPTEIPTQPPAPKWPVNDPPTPAKVNWDSQGLRISASNSSLSQILTEVASRTGAKLEGVSSDERVYGEYGPGQARDVLAQLLHGSGYNVMLIGDQGQGTPRQIVLSRGRASSSAPKNAAPQAQDSDDDQEPVQEEPQPEPPPQPQPIQQRPRTFQPGQPGQVQPMPGAPPQPPQNNQPQQ